MKAKKDHRRRIFRTVAEAESLHTQIAESAAKTAAYFRSFSGQPIALLKALRFDLVGSDPLTGDPLNVVEQLNQTFTILVTLKAIETLITLHPEASEGFRLALGTSSGRDIESVEPNYIVAEAFAATSPNSNRKLAKDVERLAADTARFRYAFFAAPNYKPGRELVLEKHPEFKSTRSAFKMFCPSMDSIPSPARTRRVRS